MIYPSCMNQFIRATGNLLLIFCSIVVDSQNFRGLSRPNQHGSLHVDAR
jgi:hypothetical protein